MGLCVAMPFLIVGRKWLRACLRNGRRPGELILDGPRLRVRSGGISLSWASVGDVPEFA